MDGCADKWNRITVDSQEVIPMDTKMKLVEAAEIPEVSKIIDVPLDDLLEVYKVCRKMEVCCDINHGIGLSAVQVGIPWKLFLVKLDGSSFDIKRRKYGYFVNCEYEPVGQNKVKSMEGCLSLMNQNGQQRFFVVERWEKVRVKGFILSDESKLMLEDVDLEIDVHKQGVVFQHEIDHHRGVLISDIGNEIFVW
jgi:peptide deformylase